MATSTSKKAIPRSIPIPRTLVMAARKIPVIASRFSMASRLLPLWTESSAEIADTSTNKNNARVARASTRFVWLNGSTVPVKRQKEP